MTPTDFANQLKSKIDELRANNKPFKLAVLSSVAEVSERAFTNKLNNTGQSFQYNSTTPIYVNDVTSPRKLSGKGKNGSSTFKSGEKKGQKHKSTYFDSYKAFRDAIGRDTDAVDWQLSGDLMSDYGNSPKGTSVSGLKPAVMLDINNYITNLTREINILKYDGLSDRYGKFLELSKPEITNFYRINELELALFLSK